MKLVLDTNVLIAAHVSTHGVCAAILEYCAMHHELISSEFILAEFHEKLVQKLDFTELQAQSAESNLRSIMQLAMPSALLSPVTGDPDDDVVLATAISGKAVCIISGDHHLLDLQTYMQVVILSPTEFRNLHIGAE